jgi:hypothetical protein
MSRVNREKIKTISDGTEKQVVYNQVASKKVHRKVGHKGDYAIVKFTSPFISSVKTGGGTSSDPYIYMLDVEDTLIDSIAANKSKLLEQMDDSKEINSRYNIIETERLNLLKGMGNMFSFNVDLLKLSLKITDIGNSKNKGITVSKTIPPKVHHTRENIIRGHNNSFSVSGDIKLSPNPSIKYNLRLESKDELLSTAPTPCEYGYKLHIHEVNTHGFIFKITHNEIPITFGYLEEKMQEKMLKASIDFLIEYK